MTIKQLAEQVAAQCWENLIHEGPRVPQEEISDMANIIEAAIRERAKRTKHSGDCSIYACREGTDKLEQGICCCGYGHQLTWDGDQSEMYSQELLTMMEFRNMNQREAKGDTDE